MRSSGTAGLLLALLALAGCAGGDGDAGDVPTITTRPSPSSGAPTDGTTVASPSPPTETPTTVAPPTSAPPPDKPRGPRTFADAEERVAALLTDEGDVVEAPRFVTPGDIYCNLDDPVIGPTCELGNGFITDARVCGADSTDRVGRIETVDRRPRPVCNADTIREPGAREVRADQVVVTGDVACAVEPIGVTCIESRSKFGFFLTSGEYQVF